MLIPSQEQVDAVLANPAALFLAPEIAPLASVLADAKHERDVALNASSCGSCKDGIRAKYEIWYAQHWLPKLIEVLNGSDSVRSVFTTILQASESCPA